VYFGPSLIDYKPAIIIDYSKTTLLAHHVRDEMRLIAPNTYLGQTFWKSTPLLHFALQFPE
jgi:hypothetical protein